MTWPTATLDEVCEINVGRTPARKEPRFWGPGEPWLSIADMGQGRAIRTTKEQITAAGAAGGRQVAPGTVLLSFKLSIGKVARAGVPLYTNEAIAALPVKRPDRLDEAYLCRVLESLDLAAGSNRAAMGKTLNKAKLKQIQIPLPPLPEQRRIAAILEHADALRAKRRHVLTHLDALTRSTFHSMFGDPASNSRGTPTARIDALAEVMTGNSPSRADSGNFGDSIEWVKSDNLGGDVATRADEWLSEQGRTKARIAPSGSILVTCIAGSPTSIGKASLVDRDVAFNQQINAILPSPRVNSAFLLGQLKAAPELVRAKSTGGMKGLVNKSAFQSIEVLSPPLDAQNRFASRVAAITRQAAATQRARAAAEDLFATLQSRAFRGEL